MISDALAILGRKNCFVLGSAAGKLRRHQRGMLWSTNAADRYVNIEDAVRAVEEYPRLEESTLVGISALRFGPPSLMAFLHYLFSETDRAAADHFFASLVSGEGLTRTNAVYHLRERLTRNREDTKAKLTEKEIAALTIIAWNSRDRPLKTLRWRTGGNNPMDFPEIR